MPRKLTASAKAKLKKRASREIEDAKDLPHDIKRSMTEGLFRIGWDATKIIKETGLPHDSVYRHIQDFEEQGTYRPGVNEKAIAWARKYGSSAAAKKFKVDVQVVKDWMKGKWGL